ncbi:MAG TPA: translocation/assembly module TamB, partial [Phenylobacterium sp.]|nr:translocation/assembly module TamB [Phenylobacterium sp.]
MTAEETTPPPAPPRRRRRTVLIVLASVVAVLVGLGALVRFGVLLPQVQLMIEARTDGLKLGRFGRLKIYGLSGDLWRRFKVERLTIADEKGVWLDARKIDLSWRYGALLQRRFVADRVSAGHVLLIRRPTLAPKGPASRGLPLTFDIDALKARVEMTPQFSYERGVYDLIGDLELRRAGGGQTLNLQARSLLRPGDFARVDLDMGARRSLKVDIDAVEAEGGAIAGALGLDPDAPFRLVADAGGKDGSGAFNVLARSGALQPLRSSGRWTRQGASATGSALLGASTHTQGLARRFGPVAAFALSSRALGEGAQDIRLGVDTRSLKLTAAGPVDPGRRATRGRGLAANVQLQDLAALVPAVGGEQARFSGFLSGDPGAWRLAGRIEGDEVGQPAFRLTRLGGPVEVAMKARELSIEADLTGAGGQGTAAALLGAAPRAQLAVTRLADGRILMRSIRIDGSGLDVNASGRRGLLGDLALSGDARLSNLSALRRGARGALAARWTAGQSRAGEPWRVGVQASGDGLALGMAELDRLLGPRPKLDADLAWGAGRLAVSQAKLTGSAATATAAGVRDAAGQLSFKLGWTANGPFRAGPVEIAGKVSGDGALTGTLAEPRADLTADVERIDIPRLPLSAAKVRLQFARARAGTNGQVSITASSPFGPARGASAFRFAPG